MRSGRISSSKPFADSPSGRFPGISARFSFIIPRSGWRYWSAVNNTEVGLWYTIVTFSFLLGGGVLALLMRYQLAVPNHDFLGPEAYNQLFTMHGSVMMFLVAVPFLEAVAIYFLPQLLGARDLPEDGSEQPNQVIHRGCLPFTPPREQVRGV
jgi:hypothetical protein